jgi:hypothetical protein
VREVQEQSLAQTSELVESSEAMTEEERAAAKAVRKAAKKALNRQLEEAEGGDE